MPKKNKKANNETSDNGEDSTEEEELQGNQRGEVRKQKKKHKRMIVEDGKEEEDNNNEDLDDGGSDDDDDEESEEEETESETEELTGNQKARKNKTEGKENNANKKQRNENGGNDGKVKEKFKDYEPPVIPTGAKRGNRRTKESTERPRYNENELIRQYKVAEKKYNQEEEEDRREEIWNEMERIEQERQKFYGPKKKTQKGKNRNEGGSRQNNASRKKDPVHYVTERNGNGGKVKEKPTEQQLLDRIEDIEREMATHRDGSTEHKKLEKRKERLYQFLEDNYGQEPANEKRRLILQEEDGPEAEGAEEEDRKLDEKTHHENMKKLGTRKWKNKGETMGGQLGCSEGEEVVEAVTKKDKIWETIIRKAIDDTVPYARFLFRDMAGDSPVVKKLVESIHGEEKANDTATCYDFWAKNENLVRRLWNKKRNDVYIAVKEALKGNVQFVSEPPHDPCKVV